MTEEPHQLPFSFPSHLTLILHCLIVVMCRPGTRESDMADLSVNGLPLLLGAGGALLGGVTLACPWLRRSTLPAVLLLVGAPLLAGVYWQRLSGRSEDHSSHGARADYRVELREVRTLNVVTDRGRRIPLGVLGRPVSTTDLSGVENNHIQTHDLNRKFIVQTAPDASHNCHGWLFTGGQFWVAGDVVDDILSDNQYTQVSTPTAGDLAVYRGARGEVVHTGIVRSAEGCTLVESKWGPMSRFIHRPEDQPFGGACTFYRSDRRGHLLRGLSLEEAQTVSQDAPR